MPKRSYPFDYYSHNSQTKVFVPDKEYLADVYERTIKRLFEAATTSSSSPSKFEQKTLSNASEIESGFDKQDPNQAELVCSTSNKNEPNNDNNNNNIIMSCNHCLDINNEIVKIRCDFCEKFNCMQKCLCKCSICNYNYCSNCITISYEKSEPEYICYTCADQ